MTLSLHGKSRTRRGGLVLVGLLAVLIAIAAGAALSGNSAGAVPITIVDEQGANDEPGQKDLTLLTVDNSGLPTSIAISWNWDDTGTNGANTLDACALFDSDGDGNVNIMLCETTQGDPGVEIDTRVFNCTSDNQNDGCGGPVAVVSFASSCSVAVSADDPFTVGGNDLKATCTAVMSDFGATSAQLVNVCTFASQSPTSDSSDCVLTPQATPTATLTVIKTVQNTSGGEAEASDFTITVTGTNVSPSATFPGAAAPGTAVILDEGTFSLSETLADGYQFVSITGDGCPTALDQSVAISGGADITCTITNTDVATTLTVTKVVDNTAGGTATADQFTLSVTGSNPSPSSFAGAEAPGTAVTLEPGNYSVVETTIVDDYVVGYSAGCAGTAEVGGSYSCVVTNTFVAGPSMTIAKTTNGSDGPHR